MKPVLILAAMMLLGVNVTAQTKEKKTVPATQRQVTVLEAKQQKEAAKQQTVERGKQLQDAKRQRKADATQQKTVAKQKAAAPAQQTRAAGTQAKADSLTKGRAKMQQRLRKMNGGRTVSTDTVNGKKVVRPVRHTAKGKAKLTKRPQVGDTVTVNGRKMVVRGS